MTAEGGRLPVLIVGAGPTGLSAALALARWQVPSIVIDEDETIATEGSRSICVQAHTLAIFERLGARAVADEGISWNVGRTYYRDRELFQVRLSDVGAEEFPRFVNIPQWRVEQILLEAAEREPLIDIAWRSRVDALAQEGDGITVRAGDRSWRGSYLIAADGGHSTVRDLAGIPFPGSDHADRFLIADVHAKLPFPNERRFFFDPPFNPGRQVLIHPQPDDVWRIDWRVPREFDLAAERASGGVDRRIRQIVGDTPYEIVWVTSYVFHQRLAPTFRKGRLFLAGDAAHLMSVFGARGMNSAVQDADNLAWKLALAWRGLAPDVLLDTYHAERHPAAVENLRITGNTMRFLAPPNALMRLRRNLILRASRFRWVRRHVDSGRLSEPFAYAGSPIVDGDGAVVPDRPVVHDTVPTRLRHCLGASFILALPEPHTVATRTSVPLSVVVDESLAAPILVRPDGHLAARLASVSDLQHALARATASRSVDAGEGAGAE
jgi:2-polyprenyl-6-methoxyphenol hydroxylase-like FAD-dependent oxidoreductase